MKQFFTFVRAISLLSSLFVFSFSLEARTEPSQTKTGDPFPVYETIKANVDFWEKIYTRYHTRQGVIHDPDNIEIVYEVVDLAQGNRRSIRRQNIRKIRSVKQKYRDILRKLAKGEPPETDEETRVAAMFGSKTDPLVYLEAANNIRFQRGQADRFRNGIIRSGAYLDKIKSIFRDYQLPEDLCYLPHVESSFHPKAYSKFGAAGIWQFTYGTGKRFMSINYVVDERRDPIVSSYAAAKLLKQNYQKLENWALAITAYNHGVNSMLRAQKEKGDYETIVNEYDGRRFKFASKNFYSEFLAARKIAKNVEHYFGKLKLDTPPEVTIVKLSGYAPLEEITKHFGVTEKTIRDLNPALREPVFRKQKYIPANFELKLPGTEKVAALTQSIPEGIYEKEQKRSRFYYVQKGDVAGAIARAHGITLRELIMANNLNHRATIYVGQNLRIPTKEDTAQMIAKLEKESKVIDISKQTSLAPKMALEKGEKAANINLSVVSGDLSVKRLFKKKDETYGVIHVDTGETLGHYAEWLDVPTQHIRNLNGLPFGRGINYKDRIIIPLTRVPRQEFEEKRYEYHKEFEEDFLSAYKIDTVREYKVRSGDTIWSLCKQTFDLPFWLIRKYNPDVDLQHLKPYQTITVPIVEKRGELLDEDIEQGFDEDVEEDQGG